MGKRVARSVAEPNPSQGLRVVGRYRVLFADCDPMRIMYYSSYLRLFEIGRAELFRILGHPFPRYIASGLYLAVTECHCRYIRPAAYDEQLDILAAVGEVHRARLRIDYEIRRAELGETVAAGYTWHAVVNEQGRPVRLPAELRTMLTSPAH